MKYYNGSTPLKKEPVIERLHEIVEVLNFLAENDIQDGQQFENLIAKLIESSEEAYNTLKKLDFKIGTMTNIAKLILLAQDNNNEYSDELKKQLIKLNVSPKITYEEIIDKIETSKKSRDFLYNEFENIQKDIQKYKSIKYVVTKTENVEKYQGKKL